MNINWSMHNQVQEKFEFPISNAISKLNLHNHVEDVTYCLGTIVLASFGFSNDDEGENVCGVRKSIIKQT